MFDHAQVVADEQIGQPQLLAQVHEQVEDLSLDGDVQSRHRLVAHQHRRLHGQRPGNADALALAATELVRVTVAQRRVQAGAFELRTHVVVQAARIGEAMQLRGLTHDARHAQTRIQTRMRVLEHHLHAQPCGQAPQRGLAATRLTDQTNHFAGPHAQGNVVQRMGHGRRVAQADAAQDTAQRARRRVLTETLADARQLDERQCIRLHDHRAHGDTPEPPPG